MPTAEYKDIPGGVDCTVKPDLSKLKNKSVIVTGGANGLGEAYVRAFAKAGAYVTIADFNEELGQKVADEFPNVQFSKCDVRIWEEQAATFKLAIANSPNKSVDIVIANAGVSGQDDLNIYEDPLSEPTKPDLRITNINIDGVLYTTKLAQHYFRGNPEAEDRDRCLILKASLSGYLDTPTSPLYQTSKYAVRGLMHSLRQAPQVHGIRTNVVAPWFIKSDIMPQEAWDMVRNVMKVEFAKIEDAAECMLRIATDKSINGRSFGIVPRELTDTGYEDLQFDDYKEGEFLYILENRIKLGKFTRPTVFR